MGVINGSRTPAYLYSHINYHFTQKGWEALKLHLTKWLAPSQRNQWLEGNAVTEESSV